MELIQKYLGAGKIYKNSRDSVICLTIQKFDDINKIIIPFFNNNNLHGIKLLEFLKFCQVANLMIEKKHLTLEGLDQIKSIKEQMDIDRKTLS
jgi:hypothetical protein